MSETEIHPPLESYEDREISIIDRLPAIRTIGADDPLQRTTDQFPGRSFHAFISSTDRQEFELDEFFAGGVEGVGNNFAGAGLYTTDRKLAGLYADSFGKKGKVTEILPHCARMIDWNDPDSRKPLDLIVMQSMDDFVQEAPPVELEDSANQASFNRYFRQQHGANYVTRDEMNSVAIKLKMNWQDAYPLAKRRNTLLYLQQAAAGKEQGLSLHTIVDGGVTTADGSYILLDRTLAQQYLMEQGVDGVLTWITPSVDKGQPYQIAAYWRNDQIGDKATWKERRLKQRRFGKMGSRLAREAFEQSGEKQVLQARNTALSGERHIGSVAFADIKQDFKNGYAFTEEDGKGLWQLLLAEKADPRAIVGYFASRSNSASRLMSAEVGVWEGYRLHEHTQAVIGQFERYEAQRIHNRDTSTRQYNAVVRLALLLQDIGKPLSVSPSADEGGEATYNAKIAGDVLGRMPLAEDVRSYIKDLIAQDHIGSAVKAGSQQSIVRSGGHIQQLVNKHSGLVPQVLTFELMKQMYTADASAYTAKARFYSADEEKYVNCKPSLDHLFEYASRASLIRLAQRPRQIVDGLQRYAR